LIGRRKEKRGEDLNIFGGELGLSLFREGGYKFISSREGGGKTAGENPSKDGKGKKELHPGGETARPSGRRRKVKSQKGGKKEGHPPTGKKKGTDYQKVVTLANLTDRGDIVMGKGNKEASNAWTGRKGGSP